MRLGRGKWVGAPMAAGCGASPGTRLRDTPAARVPCPRLHARVARVHSILAMITSAPGEWPSDVTIRAWRDAGLNVPCKVRFKLFTLDDGRVLRKLGTLAPGDRQAVGGALSRRIAAG